MSIKIIILVVLLLIGSGVFLVSCAKVNKKNINNKKPLVSFYGLEATSIDGDIIKMSDFKNKNILVVNVASKCGYTPQYKGLQELYDTYKEELYILAFPSNDFLRQEPGTNDQIKNFCEVNFGIKFDIFEKISVKGKNVHPIYQWLSDAELNGWNNQEPTWNFSKYLIDKDGNLLGLWGPSIDPQSKEIVNFLKN
jgi:glutathione peroxidase